MTVLGGVLLTLGYTGLTRFLLTPKANRVLWITTVVVLVLMAANPFRIENVPGVQIVILQIMHLVTALLPAYRFTHLG